MSHFYILVLHNSARLALACGVVAASLFQLPVFAQPVSNSDETEDIEITVTGKILRQPVYSPLRRDSTVQDATRPTYVITRPELEQRGARTVQEAIKYLPGVLSDGTAGGQLGANSSQFIRGSNSAQVLILLDGRPISDVGFGGGFDLSEISVDSIQQIELVPGGGSTLYGSDAIGGVINIVTVAPPTKDIVVVQPRLSIGSFGFNQQALQTSGRSGNIGFVFGYNRTQAQNDFPFRIDAINLSDTRRNADVLYNNFNAKLELNLDDRNTLRLNTLFLTRDFGIAGGVPIPGTVGAFNSLTPNARQYTRSALTDLTLTSKLGEGNDSLLTAKISADFLQYNSENPGTFGSRDRINRSYFGLQVQHNWQFAQDQNLTYGFDYRNTQADNQTFDLSSQTNTENYNSSIGQGALFARYEINVSPTISLNAGLRQDFSSLANASVTSPSVGGKFVITDSTTLRANYASTFRTPLISDFAGLAAFNVAPNPNLKPERGNSIDFGIDQKLGNFGLVRLTYFINTISDLISFNFGNPSTLVNIGEVRTEGLELAVNLEVAPNVNVFSNFTLNDPRIVSDRNASIIGNNLSFRGAESFNIGVSYEHSGIYAALLAHAIGGFFTTNNNRESLPGYTTLDFKLRVPITSNLKLSASVDNILDYQYQVFPGFPGISRSFRLGADMTF